MSNNHPGQEFRIIKTLVDYGKRIFKPTLLQAKLKHLHIALKANGYSEADIHNTINRKRASYKSY